MVSVALDLAGSTGVAVRFASGDVKLVRWCLTRNKKHLEGKRNPIPSLRLWRRLNRLAADYDIGHITFEETFARGAARYRLDSLQHTVVLWCLTRQVRWTRISPSGWKKAMLGSGFVKSDDYWRQAVVRWPDLKFHCSDLAAARWILEYAATLANQKLSGSPEA